MDQGCRPGRSIGVSTRWSAKKLTKISSNRRRPRAGLAGSHRRRASRATTETEIRQAPELTPVFSAAAPVAGGSTLLVTDNDRDFTRTVRKQRGSLLIALGVVTTLSVLLSLFLARTIVRPLAPDRARRASGPAWPGARGQGSAPPLADRRNRPACSLDQRHEPVAAAADRQYRGICRGRHARAQEPAGIAALRDRRARTDRRSRACASN